MTKSIFYFFNGIDDDDDGFSDGSDFSNGFDALFDGV